MKVALIHDAHFPVQGYGGTERVVWWLARGLKELGAEIYLVARSGSSCPFARCISPQDFSERMVDVIHYFNTPPRFPSKPYVVTIGGNGKAGETYLPNTVFVSQNHAERHGATAFVHNGLDPLEYVFQENKENSLLFLAKASWRVKNVKGAIRIARKARSPLHVVGGKHFLFKRWRGVHWEGTLSGQEKAQAIADSKALLFPVLWHEPFGIAVIEALVSGTPVLATPFGSLPELVGESVGVLCRNDDEFLAALDRLDRFSPKQCRDWVLEKFTLQHMAASYLTKYEQVLSGERLNAREPRATQDEGRFLNYGLSERAFQ